MPNSNIKIILIIIKLITISNSFVITCIVNSSVVPTLVGTGLE